MSDDLRARLRAGGFTPPARSLPALLHLLADPELGAAAMTAALTTPSAAAEAAQTISATAPAPIRARLCELVGRIARTSTDPSLATWLTARLSDDDPKVRRRAIAALGKLEDPRHEDELLSAWDRATSRPIQPAARLSELRAIATALGSCGRDRARARLSALPDDDPELVRIAAEAAIKIDRELARTTDSAIDLDAHLPPDTEVLLHVRPGLEELTMAELAHLPVKSAGRGRVAVRGARDLRRLFAARTFMHLGFPLAPRKLARGQPREDAVIDAMLDARTLAILRALTRGPIRWRLQWNDAGHRRAATFRVAQQVAQRCPELVNDAREAPWVVGVSERGDRIFVELWPRAAVDPRFTWRSGAVPAASHPTVAAALARITEPRGDDVVWDPFCGSGSELVERALLGRFAELHGSDLDPTALALAKDNLDRAHVTPTSLTVADARTHRPSQRPISLVLTNPPLGFRVTNDAPLRELTIAALDHWCDLLAPRGRIVWISPMPGLTASHPRLHAELRLRVDLGGLQAEIQRLVPASRRR